LSIHVGTDLAAEAEIWRPHRRNFQNRDAAAPLTRLEREMALLFDRGMQISDRG
jgi:hypothetical protein